MDRILLVEDEAELARAIMRELEAEGYHVEHATNGLDALDLQKSTSPDLVVLHWMLPGLDGLEVLRRIRQRSATPVLMLTAREEPKSVILDVHDTGEGIAPEDLPQIWERFYRSESSRSRTRDRGGAGLGLALVKEMTEAMGGSVSVESKVGQGSRFTVRLPAEV